MSQVIAASKIKMAEVESSNLHSIGYNETLHLLAIKYKSGSTYLYLNVPTSIYTEMMNEKSKGSYVSNVIKKFYYCVELIST